ncbi:MAG: diguanylate cyclase [Raoultibacter sp.]
MKTDSDIGTVPSRLAQEPVEFVGACLGKEGDAPFKESLKQVGSSLLTREAHESALSFVDREAQVNKALRVARIGVKSSFDDKLCTYRYVSDSLCDLLGYTHAEFMEMSGGVAVGSVYPPDLPAASAEYQRGLAQNSEYHTEYRMRKKDGTLLWVTDSGCRVLNQEGETVINSVITDISEYKETLENLRIEQERYEIVAELSDEVICEYDVRADTLEVFSSKLDLFEGLPHRRGIFNNFLRDRIPAGELVAPEDKERLCADVEEMLTARQEASDFYSLEYRLRLRNDRAKDLFITDVYTPCRVLFRRIFDSEGKLVKLVGKITDISHEFVLRHQSATDALTGAYNRSYLRKEVEDYGRRKSSDLSFAVLLFDVDFFKTVNDSYGHLAGDKMLIELVNMARLLFRHTDVIARLGGDEFVVFMRDIYDVSIVQEKTEMLLSRFKQLAEESGYPDEISLSIGIVVSDENDVIFSQLYQKADIALYRAKGQGKDCAVFYEPGMTHPLPAS